MLWTRRRLAVTAKSLSSVKWIAHKTFELFYCEIVLLTSSDVEALLLEIESEEELSSYTELEQYEDGLEALVSESLEAFVWHLEHVERLEVAECPCSDEILVLEFERAFASPWKHDEHEETMD